MLWESLITEGHVRAARIRVVQPSLIGLAFILIFFGLLLLRLLPSQPAPASAREQVAQRVNQAQLAAAAPFSRLSPPVVDRENAASLPNAEDLPAFIQNVTQSLASKSSVPGDVKTIDPEGFFKGDWPIGTVIFIDGDDECLLAMTVNTQPAGRSQYYSPARWIGVFKKVKGQWSYATLSTGATYVPRGFPVVGPQEIPLTLSQFLPVKK